MSPANSNQFGKGPVPTPANRNLFGQNASPAQIAHDNMQRLMTGTDGGARFSSSFRQQISFSTNVFDQIVSKRGGGGSTSGGGQVGRGSATGQGKAPSISSSSSSSIQKTIFKINKLNCDKAAVHDKFGKFYRNENNKEWWVKDRAQHGGSHWKVFKETKKGLEWSHDADIDGKAIMNKHKSDVGKFIPWKELNGRNIK